MSFLPAAQDRSGLAALMSVGSLFHHHGAREANNPDFVELQLGCPRRERVTKRQSIVEGLKWTVRQCPGCSIGQSRLQHGRRVPGT